MQALYVTSEILPILGIQPMLGRQFSPEDDAPDAASTVLLTSGYWQRIRRRPFGDRPDSRLDPLTYVLVTLVLVAVATLAAYLPAWRASRNDPIEALRCG